MIIQEKVKIIINNRNHKYYKTILENIKNGIEYEIDIDRLHKGSHSLILVECDICHKQSLKPYRQYLESYNKENFYCCSPQCAQIKNKKTNINKYGVENVFQIKEIKEKIIKTNIEKYGVSYGTQSNNFKEKSKLTNIERYGVENASQSEYIKTKMKETCLNKYGTENYTQSEIYKNVRINNGTKIPDILKTKFEIYTTLVRNETNKRRKELFKSWDGFDYYDNEYIKEFTLLDNKNKSYPTIDHKISIFYGFNNEINPMEIAKYENLCITKRSVNSSKWIKCE